MATQNLKSKIEGEDWDSEGDVYRVRIWRPSMSGAYSSWAARTTFLVLQDCRAIHWKPAPVVAEFCAGWSTGHEIGCLPFRTCWWCYSQIFFLADISRFECCRVFFYFSLFFVSPLVYVLFVRPFFYINIIGICLLHHWIEHRIPDVWVPLKNQWRATANKILYKITSYIHYWSGDAVNDSVSRSNGKK